MPKLNLDPEDIMNRVFQIYGEGWGPNDVPSYYRKEQAEREERIAEELKREQFFEEERSNNKS